MPRIVFLFQIVTTLHMAVVENDELANSVEVPHHDPADEQF
jgi:hypothetical protein